MPGKLERLVFRRYWFSFLLIQRLAPLTRTGAFLSPGRCPRAWLCARHQRSHDILRKRLAPSLFTCGTLSAENALPVTLRVNDVSNLVGNEKTRVDSCCIGFPSHGPALLVDFSSAKLH